MSIKLARLMWMPEEELPRMKDETHAKLLTLAQPERHERYYPHVVIGGELVFLTSIFPAKLKREA